jgi:protein phosphatase
MRGQTRDTDPFPPRPAGGGFEWPPRGREAAPRRVLELAAATHQGLVRERNEDAYALMPEIGAALVADGMGGRLGGAEAARFAIETMRTALAEAARHGPPSTEALDHAARLANARIHGVSLSEPELCGMGTTIAGVWAHGCRACIVHVGDTRIYLLRGGVLVQLTADHTIAAAYLRAGIIDVERAARAPYRHALTRALGPQPDVEPETRVLALRPGDRLLICSDGLTGEVSEPEIGAVLAGRRDADSAAEALVREALAGGGRDNVTAVVVDVRGCPLFAA